MECFAHIDLSDTSVSLGPFFEEARSNGAPHMRDALYDIRALADGATAFFSGIYPIETPYNFCGSFIFLPWHDDYWRNNKNGETMSPLSIEVDVQLVAKKLLATPTGDSEDRPYLQVTYESEQLCMTPKGKVQGLATEALLCLDRALEHLADGRSLQAMNWMSGAYKNTLEATVQAHLILGISSENARLGADARHRENRAMKQDVFAWCDAHMKKYSNMDDAAFAVAEKLVPIKFRAVRSWMTEWKKVRSTRIT